MQDSLAEVLQGSNAVDAMLALFALCMTGDLETVQTCAIQAQKRIDPGTARFANTECVEFLAGPLSLAAEEKLLEKARNGYAAINAHFAIAMTRLAARDRESAMLHLEQCTDTVAIGNLSYEMARAILDQMDANSAWPSWLATGLRD